MNDLALSLSDGMKTVSVVNTQQYGTVSYPAIYWINFHCHNSAGLLVAVDMLTKVIILSHCCHSNRRCTLNLWHPENNGFIQNMLSPWQPVIFSSEADSMGTNVQFNLSSAYGVALCNDEQMMITFTESSIVSQWEAQRPYRTSPLHNI
jgi:hypothetical protein